MRKSRSLGYRSSWGKLIETHGSLCFYCQLHPASCIDHIVPLAHYEDDGFDNLVPSCTYCNLIAGDMVFQDVWQKRQYIINKRKRKLSHAVCSDCLLPFKYRTHSPSLFLCAECYDFQYGTTRAKRKGWGIWLEDLSLAGFDIESHRQARDEIVCLKDHGMENKKAYLILHKYMALAGYYEEC